MPVIALKQRCGRACAGLSAALLGAANGDSNGAGAGAAGEGGGGGGIAALVSAKEERDLGALLELFALGVGDVDQFQERLQAELAALEARARPAHQRSMCLAVLETRLPQMPTSALSHAHVGRARSVASGAQACRQTSARGFSTAHLTCTPNPHT